MLSLRPIMNFALAWIVFVSSYDAIAQRSNQFFPKDNSYANRDDGCALTLNRSYSPLQMNPFSSRRTTKVCIRYEDVNRALAKAKYKLRYVQPRAYSIDVDDIDRSAELIIETTKLLAIWFQLSPQEINFALPTIDTSKTDIWQVCPAHFKPTPCIASRFRSIDAHCNNMKHSVWGASSTPFVRFLPPVYANGVDSPRVSRIDGRPLPNARRVSATIHKDYNQPSEVRSILLTAWGQFIDHDLTLAAVVREANEVETTCCDVPRQFQHKNCMPIEVPQDDPFYSRYGVRCIDFLRTPAGHRPGCTLGPRVHINLLTSPIDASFIYGSTDHHARQLRLGSKGLMRTWDLFQREGLKALLPPLSETPEKDCIARPRHLHCFLAGDERVNEQIHLTVLHTLYVRDHNRIAKQLAFRNPHWDDERLYQETRHIMAAAVQHIAYNEFLPLILGPKFRQMYNLTLQPEGYWYGYDENTYMGPSNSFQTAAFRFGHTHIQSRVRMYDKNHNFLVSHELRDLLRKPFILYEPGVMDKLIGGLLNTPAQVYDPFITSEVTNHLFQEPTSQHGRDLVSLNLMRGREHGVPGYNDFREWCGFPRIQTFRELEFYMANGTAYKYSKLYKHPDDIDLWSAGVSERLMDGAMVGPTFACIIAAQFRNLRRGDRFWYENPGFPSSFTPGQLREIRKALQAKVLCDNADDMPTIQPYVMQMPHTMHNPRLNCKDMPSINLDYWIEDRASGRFRYIK